MHRLMVTSSTYRMQSWITDTKDPDLRIDAENRYFWRMNPQRMQAEVVRDSMLALSRQLEPKIGGPSIDETDQESRRRSLYFRQTPDNQMVFLQVFDGANPIECYERSETVAPQQALALSNSKLSFTTARLITRQLGEETPPAPAFIAKAFELILGRPPSDGELALSQKYLQEQEERLRPPAKSGWPASDAGPAPNSTPGALRARENMIHALLNHNDFVTIR
jgi:hypothetical protein